MFNLCWTETHARTIVGRSYADPAFHANVKAIYFQVKAEREDADDDTLKELDAAVIDTCSVFLRESVPDDENDDDAPRATDLTKECSMLE